MPSCIELSKELWLFLTKCNSLDVYQIRYYEFPVTSRFQGQDLALSFSQLPRSELRLMTYESVRKETQT